MTLAHAFHRILSVAIAGAAITVAGCSKESTKPASSTPPFLDTPVTARPASTDETIAEGKRLYDVNCAHCHGAAGEGDGYGAPFLVPAPRDFVAAQYKFRTTASGSLPTDEDLFRTISRGANGTGMPPWQYLLSDAERWALVDYIKTFSPRFESAHGVVTPMSIVAAPSKRRNIEHGRAVYERMQCAKCHGADGRGVGPSAPTLTDTKGRYVNSRDFTQAAAYRTGFTEREIVRTMETGMNGVPMPSYSGTMTPEEEYDLVAYLMSLAGSGPGDQKRQTVRGMTGLGAPDRVMAIREHAWKYEPSEIRIKAGEVVRIDFSVTDNGLGAGHGFAIDGLDQDVFINGAMVGAPASVTFKADAPGRYNFYCATQCSTTELHPRMHGVLIVE